MENPRYAATIVTNRAILITLVGKSIENAQIGKVANQVKRTKSVTPSTNKAETSHLVRSRWIIFSNY